MNDLLSTAWSLVVALARPIVRYVKEHPYQLLGAVLVVIILNMAAGHYYREAVREITIYVGPPGSSSYRMRDRLAEAVDQISVAPGFHYRALIFPTAGYVDIEQRVSDDMHGHSIGLTVDGIHQDPALKTLLPLDWDYLHVLVSVRFLRDIYDRNPGQGWPTEFGQIVPYLTRDKYDRVFGGAAESGTRKFASLVFDLYGLDINSFNSPAISDWEQAIPALRAGRLDLAFYCGPLGATSVERIAGQESAVLLGLADVQMALVKQQDYSLLPNTIPKNLYAASPVTVPEADTRGASPHEESEISEIHRPPLYFGNRDIPTVAARRLIITNQKMTKWDAYHLTKALTEKLTENKDIPPNTWERRTPDSAPANIGSDFGIPPHPGALLHRDKIGIFSIWQPSTWDASWRSFLLGMVTLFATSLLQRVLKRVQRGGEAAAEPTTPTTPPPTTTPPTTATTAPPANTPATAPTTAPPPTEVRVVLPPETPPRRRSKRRR